METPAVFPLYFGSRWKSPEGTEYDLTARYRDTDGLIWHVCGWEFYFLRQPVPLLECTEQPSLKAYSLPLLEEFHGPLRQVHICATACDADCEAECHEEHAVSYKREHNAPDRVDVSGGPA